MITVYRQTMDLISGLNLRLGLRIFRINISKAFGDNRPRNFSSVKVSKAEFGGGGWLVV